MSFLFFLILLSLLKPTVVMLGSALPKTRGRRCWLAGQPRAPQSSSELRRRGCKLKSSPFYPFLISPDGSQLPRIHFVIGPKTFRYYRINGHVYVLREQKRLRVGIKIYIQHCPDVTFEWLIKIKLDHFDTVA